MSIYKEKEEFEGVVLNKSSLEKEKFEVVRASHWLQALEVVVAFHSL